MPNSETKVGNMSASAMIQQPAPLQQDGNLAGNWKEWKTSFDYFLIAAGKDSAPSKEKCGLFMHVIGKYGREIYEELDVAEEIKQDYSSLCIKFAEHCDPTKNINYERHMFFETYQNNNDFDIYLGELKVNSKNCEFGSLRNSLILTQMIRGLKDNHMREKLLAKTKLLLDEAIQWCRAAERAGRQGAACEASAARAAGSSVGAAASVEQVARGAPSRARRRARPGNRARHPGPHGNPTLGSASSRSDTYRSPGSVCGKCAYQHASDRCPASSARCRRCQMVGHYAKCCRVRFMKEVQERDDDSCGEECGDYDNDDNERSTNEETTHRCMAETLIEVPAEEPEPRPANWCLTLMRNMANWLMQSQPPNVEMVTLTAGRPRRLAGRRRRKAARRRQISPTSVLGLSMINAAMTLLGWGLGVSLGILLVYIFVHKQAATLLKTASSDRYGDSDESYNQVSKKPEESTERPKQSGKCVLPAFPEHGIIIITNAPNATPGQTFDSLVLTVNCSDGYRALGAEIVLCVNGTWSNSIPKCTRFCKLYTNPSVRYQCRASGSTQYRNCNDYEPSGTVVKPECNRPNYYSTGTLHYMTCVDGSWDRIVDCSPECGRVTPTGVGLISGGKSAKRGEVSWHVGIYDKTFKPYKQVCGGTIISNKAVISANHCFWKKGKQQNASMYAVAAGKIYRPWNNRRDIDAGAQMSDVKEIKMPPRFQGSETNFEDDIAFVILETAFEYRTYIRPICLDLNREFDKSQLQPGNLGKVAGWGVTSENGNASQVLKVVDLPYVDIKQCIRVSPPGFREYITSDKICAGYGNGTAPCPGDSGGGLAFPESERGTDRYYLRGIVSTAATNNGCENCNTHALTTFTQIYKHKDFIEECLFELT